MQKLVLWVGLLGWAMMVGCATGPDFATYTSTLSPPKSGESRIWFYRPSKVTCSAVQPFVYVNDTPVGKSQPGCFFYVDRPPGAYELRCSTEWADKTQLTVVLNQVSYVRLSLLPGLFVGHILPKPVPEKDALKEIQTCKLITADGMNKDWKPPAKADPSK